MKISDVFKNLFQTQDGNLFDVLGLEDKAKTYVKTLAIAHAIDLIAKTISKSEIKVYKYNSKLKKINEEKDETYYRLNVKSNPNETATSLVYRLVCRLLSQNQALVLLKKQDSKCEYLYLAKSFNNNKQVVYSKNFTDIILDDAEGNTENIKETYDIEDCLYFTLGASKINTAIDDFCKELNKVLEVAARNYKSTNTKKWRLKIPTGQPPMVDPKTNKPISYEEYKNKLVEGLFGDEEKVVLLSELFDLEQLNKENSKTVEDYRNTLKDECDYIAMAFNIPLDVFYGKKSDKTSGNNDFITYSVLPIVEILEDVLNAGLIEEKDYIKGERIKFDKFNMKHYDIMDVASSLDKLTAIGFSHNDLREFLRLPLIDEPWANEHYVTKNYSNVKGGERDGR